MKRIKTTIGTIFIFAGAAFAGEWQRNTYPGPGHKANPEDYPAGQGQDRSQWLTYFGTSPVNSDFQLFCIDMAGGAAVYSKDGRSFQPVNTPVTRHAVMGAFSPHDGDTGFLVFSAGRWPANYLEQSTLSPLDCLSEGHPFGLWRTTDRGDSWQQIYEVPQGSYYLGNKPLGKEVVAVDPHPDRADNIYFGTFSDGLIRTVDNGGSWEPVAFAGRLVKTVVAGKNGAGTTLYAIVGPKVPRHVSGTEPRYDVEPPTSYSAYWDLEGDGNDASANNYDLTLNNFPVSRYVDGRVGRRGLLFDGIDDHAAIQGMNYNATHAKVTVGAWVRTTSSNNQVVASFDNSEYWQLEVRNSGKARWSVYTGGSVKTMESTHAINDGKWHHVAATFTSGKMTLYVDGILDKTRTSGVGNNFGSGTARYGFLGVGSESASFGDGLKQGGTYFDGELDDVRIYPSDLGDIPIASMALTMWEGKNLCAQGELWRIDVDGSGTVTTIAQLDAPYEDFVDVALKSDDPSRGFVIRDGTPGGSRGGNSFFRFANNGNNFTRIAAANPDNRALNVVSVNPQNSDHVVISCGATLRKGALRYSTDGGTNWQGMNRAVDGNGLCADFKSYAPLQHEYYPDGSLPGEYSPENQGANVGFKSDDPNAVYWWMTIHGKTPGLSLNQGQSFVPYAYGGSNKEARQLAVSSDINRQIHSLGEYGFAYTTDGGLSWRGTTDASDATMKAIWDQSWVDYPNDSWAYHRMGWGVAFKPDNPDVAVALYSTAPYIIRTTSSGASWNEVLDGSGKNYKATSKGVVFWHNQNTEIVYAADMKSADGGLNWSGMTHAGTPVFVLAMSSSNGDVLLGHKLFANNLPEAVTSANWNLLASIDAGNTWTVLPAPPKERVPGTSKYYHVVQFAGGRFQDTNSSAVAIDPDPAKDPTVGANKLRVLMPGRSGIYEYVASASDNVKGTSSDWTVRSAGLAPSPFFNRTQPVPWMGKIVFDTRPGSHHVAYAAKTLESDQVGAWASPENSNWRFPAGQPFQPFYKSLDGGITWTGLHGAEFGTIPQYHWPMGGLLVDGDGTLHTTSHTGIYSLPAAPPVFTSGLVADFTDGTYPDGALNSNTDWSGSPLFVISNPDGLLVNDTAGNNQLIHQTALNTTEMTVGAAFRFSETGGAPSANRQVVLEIGLSGSENVFMRLARLNTGASSYNLMVQKGSEASPIGNYNSAAIAGTSLGLDLAGGDADSDLLYITYTITKGSLESDVWLATAKLYNLTTNPDMNTPILTMANMAVNPADALWGEVLKPYMNSVNTGTQCNITGLTVESFTVSMIPDSNGSANNAPVFTVDPVVMVDATVGTAYSGTLAGSAPDPDYGDTVSYAKTSGPAWLHVASDGTLSGSPAQADIGSNSWIIVAFDGNGGTDQASLVLSVQPLSIDAGFTSAEGYVDGELVGQLGWSGNAGTFSVDTTSPGSVSVSGANSWRNVAYTPALSSGIDTVFTLGTSLSFTESAAASSAQDLFRILFSATDASNASLSLKRLANGTYRLAFYENSGGISFQSGAALPAALPAANLGTTNGPGSISDQLYLELSLTKGATAADWTAYCALYNLSVDPGMQTPMGAHLFSFASSADFFNNPLTPALNSAAQAAANITDLRLEAVEYGLNEPVANRPPVFAADPVVKADATEDLAYSGTLADVVSDPDSDSLTFAKTSGPGWLTVAANGALSGTPGNGNVGLNSFTVEVSDGNGGTDSATVEITVAGQPLGPYALWASHHEVGAMDEDFDKDGLDNLTEYALGGNPTNASDVGLLPTHLKTDDGWHYVYRRRLDPAAAGLVYTVETTTNLASGDWTDTGTVEIDTEVIDSEFESVIHAVDTTDKPALFIRLKIEAD